MPMCWIFRFKTMRIPLSLIALLLVSCLHLSAQSYTPVTLDQLPLVGVNATLQDHEGYIWYATTEGGLCRDNGYQVDIFRNNKTNTLRLGHSNGVLSICETLNGNICIGIRENNVAADETLSRKSTTDNSSCRRRHHHRAQDKRVLITL